MKLVTAYQTEFAQTDSPQFIENAKKIEEALLPVIQQSIPDVEAIKVTKLSKGSTVATFDVIMKPSAANNATLVGALGQVIEDANQAGKLNAIGVVANQTIAVKGRFIDWGFVQQLRNA